MNHSDKGIKSMTEVPKKRDSDNESFDRVPKQREKMRRYDHDHDSENKNYGHTRMNSEKYNRKSMKGSDQRNVIYGHTEHEDIIYDVEGKYKNIDMEKSFSDCRIGKHHIFVKSQDDTKPRRTETIGERSNWGRETKDDR